LESTVAIPRLALYILYYSIQGKRVFDWSRIISMEITSQLSNFKKDKKFFMFGYLVFTIIDSHEFQGLHISKQVDLMTDPFYTWYLDLWKQRAMYHFYEVYNSFLSIFKRLMFGENTSRFSLEAASFLNQRGEVEYGEDYNIIRIYCSRVAPIYLPFYVSDKMFIIEVCRQYRFWENFFAQRKKKQFIQLPWKVGEITVKNASKIDEFVVQFDPYKLKVVDYVKGFDPQQLFMNHIISTGFSVSFINTYIYEEEENEGNNSQEKLVQDLETIISTNKAYKQHGKVISEKGSKSQSSSQKSGTPKQHTQNNFQDKQNSLINNSGGDNDPDHGEKNIESTHKLPVVKRKRYKNQEETEQCIPDDDVLLQNMDLDVDIENIEFPEDERRIFQKRS
jgi:hypothetical protein